MTGSPPARDEIPEDDHVSEANLRRTLRRGNINFEFLDHRDQTEQSDRRSEPRERRRGERKDKRGLFNRGRPPRPITRLSISLWGLLCATSAAGLGSTFVFADSLLWLLGLPVLLGSFLWSLVMLALFAARPR